MTNKELENLNFDPTIEYDFGVFEAHEYMKDRAYAAGYRSVADWQKALAKEIREANTPREEEESEKKSEEDVGSPVGDPLSARLEALKDLLLLDVNKSK